MIFNFPVHSQLLVPATRSALSQVARSSQAMDFSLRCNSLKCRVQLTDRAIVTTCRSDISVPWSTFLCIPQLVNTIISHIFCAPCSENLGLANPGGGPRICPACSSSLVNPDDAVSTLLNPTEDYKTSVLSGMSPTTIMECAGRGLAFWSYQSTQEMYVIGRTMLNLHSSLKPQHISGVPCEVFDR